MGTPPAPAMKPDELIGFPGTPDIAQGTVKVVREVSDAGKLNPRDVLVTEYISGHGRACLFDSRTGYRRRRVLSLGAVAAREYGILEVVGTGTATAVIMCGQVIEVGGTAGRVRLVSQNVNLQL